MAPHQFGGPAYAPLRGVLGWMGVIMVIAGTAVVGCVILRVPRRYVVGAHFLAGGALLVFGPTFALRGAWNGLAQFTILGAGTALSVLLKGRTPRTLSAERGQRGDLFAGLVGLLSAINGSLMLLSPVLFSAPIYDGIRAQLPYLGLAFFIAGLAVIVAQLYPALPSVLFRLAHLGILVPFLAFALVDPIPNRIWTGIFFYVGFSLLVASLPWTGPRLRRLNPHSFSVRLAFLLAIGAALPMIAIAGAVTGGQERQARTEAESYEQALAIALAGDVSHYIGSHRSAAITAAAYPGLLGLAPAEQESVLRSYNAVYPDALAFVIGTASGRSTARSDGGPVDSLTGQEPFFQEILRTGRPVISAILSPRFQRPIFTINALINDATGRVTGLVGVVVESGNVARLINQIETAPGTKVYLVDASGHAIAHPDQSLVASFADLSGVPVVALALASGEGAGVASSTGAGGPSREELAAYAWVRELGWYVVVERPASDALAAVRSWRDTAFQLLVVAVVLAVVMGTLLARALARPLAVLSWATGRLASGDSGVSLPRSGTSEIRELVGTFGEMRERLVAHAAERDQLLAEAERRAAELDLSNKELEAFTYAVAHDLRSPVRHMDGFSKALSERYAGKLDERGQQYLQYVREGSVKMGQLIDDLLTLTGIARREMRHAKVDLSQMAQEIAAGLRNEQPERQVEFVIAPGIGANGDAGMLHIALDNLLDNAWKFTSKRPTARIEFGVLWQDDKAVYYVKDDGAGFDRAYADKLFRAFERLHTADDFPGTGVGLATVERVVRRHGGTVWAEGEVNKGATFYFTLG